MKPKIYHADKNGKYDIKGVMEDIARGHSVEIDFAECYIEHLKRLRCQEDYYKK